MQSATNWYRNRITWVVIIASLSACALLIIQGIWLKQTFEDEKHRLEKDLNRALPEFLFYQPELDFLNPEYSGETVSLEEWQQLKKSVEHGIAVSFKSSDITTNYVYALLNSTKDSLIYSSNPEHNIALKESTYQKCINCQGIKKLPLDSLANGSKEYDYLISIPREENGVANRPPGDTAVYLSLYFPEFDKLILQNILLQLALVILFVLLMTGCFFYILRVVHKQKKIAEIKNDFINSLTHEFKTPLASISLTTTVLQESLTSHLTARDRHHFKLMRNEQTHLESQIDKVLHMAMADAENFELELEQVDLLALTRKTLSSMELLIGLKDGQISVAPTTGNFLVKGDTTHLSNVLYNLIDNALKYCDKAPLIEITLSTQRKYVQLIITDNGVGISLERQQVVFDKFYRVHQTEGLNIQGFGLGLSYVRRIIALHHGEISLSSQPNEGSIFTLSLPGI